jgi:eukaryotic-like serine/threonine-protein kinase
MNTHPERIGPYKILPQIIGKGGFGQVFEGFHEDLQRRAAVKVLLPECLSDRDTVVRFVREAQALALFKDHPGIVQVQHFDRTQHSPYLAMELLEGKTLRQWLIDQGSPISLESALSLGQQIAATMVEVHAKGFVHRDLKPENIMLVKDDAAPLTMRPVILDFGIAKVILDAPFDDQSLTRVKTTSTNILGSLVYMAPEQILDADKATPKADVYTLGLIVYEMISGNPPFVSDSAIKLVQMHGRESCRMFRWPCRRS